MPYPQVLMESEVPFEECFVWWVEKGGERAPQRLIYVGESHRNYNLQII